MTVEGLYLSNNGFDPYKYDIGTGGLVRLPAEPNYSTMGTVACIWLHPDGRRAHTGLYEVGHHPCLIDPRPPMPVEVTTFPDGSIMHTYRHTSATDIDRLIRSHGIAEVLRAGWANSPINKDV